MPRRKCTAVRVARFFLCGVLPALGFAVLLLAGPRFFPRKIATSKTVKPNRGSNTFLSETKADEAARKLHADVETALRASNFEHKTNVYKPVFAPSPFRTTFLKNYPHRLKNPKIFVYHLPERFNVQIRRENKKCAEHMFAAEVAIHTYLQNSALRTRDPKDADFFYVPVYTTCRYTAYAGNGPDPWEGRRLMAQVIAHIRAEYSFWDRNNGADHIFATTHDYGPCFDYKRDRAQLVGPVPELSKSIVLMTLGDDKSRCYDESKDIVIPSFAATAAFEDVKIGRSKPLLRADWEEYIDWSGPQDTSQVLEDEARSFRIAQAATKRGPVRDIQCFFWGQLEWTDANGIVDDSYSHGVRQAIREHHASDDDFFLIHHVTREGTGGLDYEQYAQYLERSVFCLAPAGFAPWSGRLFEAIRFECIPVIISDSLIPPFSGQLDWDAFSVRVPESVVKDGGLKGALQSISPERVRQLQRNVGLVRSAFLYQFPTRNAGLVPNLRVPNSISAESWGNAFDFIFRSVFYTQVHST